MSLPKDSLNRFALLACSLMFTALLKPLPAQTAWSRIAQSASWTPDYSWGPQLDKGGSRLVDDGSGKLYLSMGDSLYVGESGGTIWKAAPINTDTHALRALPIAASPNGMVLWGFWMSHDWGKTWTMESDSNEIIGWSLDFVTLGSGAALAGGSEDRISLTVDSGRTWKTVNFDGQSYGNVAEFGASKNGWCFAAPETDELLASRDEGKTWVELRSLLKSGTADAIPQSLSGMFLAMENRVNDQVLWSVQVLRSLNRQLSGKPVLAEFDLSNADSLGPIKMHAATGFPDSAVSAFGIADDGGARSMLYLGTWGQGVFVSEDRGETWTRHNQGLGDLHVEAMCVPHGNLQDTILALTPDGLYKLPAFSTASGLTRASKLSPTAPLSNRARFDMGRAGILFQSPRGFLYRPDGRDATPTLPKP